MCLEETFILESDNCLEKRMEQYKLCPRDKS